LADVEADQLEAPQLARRSTEAVVCADIDPFERSQSTQPSATADIEWLTAMLWRCEACLTQAEALSDSGGDPTTVPSKCGRKDVPSVCLLGRTALTMI
jgi:hypothetical protein